MDATDMREWASYLANCSPRQVAGVYERERAAGRNDVAAFVKEWATAKGIEVG